MNHWALAIRALVLLVAATLGVVPANAAALYFLPATDVSAVQTGDVITVDVIADFTGEPTLGSSFDVVWDATALSLVSFAYNPVGETGFTREPDVVAGALELWSFGAFGGITGVNTLGTMTLEVLEGMGAQTSLEFGCFSALEACRFLSIDDFISEVPTELRPLAITRVPLPAAVWLMLGGLLALPRRRAAR